MDLRSLINKLDSLDEAFNAKTLQAAVEKIPDAQQRHVQIATLAQQNNLPGLYDPVDGQYVAANGETSRTASHEIDNMLASKGLMPQNASTSTFLGKMFGTSGDAYDKGLRGQSDQVVADQEAAEFKQKKFAELQDLMKQLSALKKIDATPAEPAPQTNQQTPQQQSATPTMPTTQQHHSVVQNKDGTFTLSKKDGTTFKISADGSVVKEMKQVSISNALIESFGYQTEALAIPPSAADELKTTAATAAAGAGAGKVASKVLGRAIPGVGTALSLKDAWDRWHAGDRTGAVIATLAGAGWLVPGPYGWVIGGALDAANLGRDWAKSSKADKPAQQSATPTTGDPKIIALQRYLKKQGLDIGATGPNHDGVDGIMGPKTRAAMDKANLNESQKMAIWRILTDSYDYSNQLNEGKLDILLNLFKMGKGATKEAEQLAKEIPIGSIAKDADGSAWKWLGGRWEKETAAGSGKFNMKAGVATPGAGKTGQVAADLEAAYRAEAEAAKSAPGGIAAWIKANPKKAAAIGLATVAAGGVTGYIAGSDNDSNDEVAKPNKPSSNTTTKQDQSATPAQVCSPEQIELIGKIKGVMGELGTAAKSDPALAQVIQSYNQQIDALDCNNNQGATPSKDTRSELERYYDNVGTKP